MTFPASDGPAATHLHHRSGGPEQWGTRAIYGGTRQWRHPGAARTVREGANCHRRGALGLVLLCLGLGSIVAMPLTGFLANRFGCRAVLVTSSLAVALILPMLAFSNNAVTLAISLTIFGASLGTSRRCNQHPRGDGREGQRPHRDVRLLRDLQPRLHPRGGRCQPSPAFGLRNHCMRCSSSVGLWLSLRSCRTGFFSLTAIVKQTAHRTSLLQVGLSWSSAFCALFCSSLKVRYSIECALHDRRHMDSILPSLASATRLLP